MIKRARAQQSQRIDNPDNEWSVIIMCVKNVNLLAVAMVLERDVGKVKLAKYLSNKSIRVQAAGGAQQDVLLNMQTLDGNKVKTHVPGIAARHSGVISGIPISVSMADIKKELKGGKVLDAKRISKIINGERVETMSVVIDFDQNMPEKVMLGFFSFTVREFIPPALRCFKCQRMGQCKGKERCGGNHSLGKCGADVPIKCCNCGGNHAYGGFEVQQHAREVQKMNIISRFSYAEAVKRVNIEKRAKTSSKEIHVM